MTAPYRSSGRDLWNEPRQPYNDGLRRHAYGPVKPMHEPAAPWGRAMLIAAALAAVVLVVGWWWPQ